MAKKRTVFFCSSCGHESAKWLGRCPGCGEWNTLVEQKVTPTRGAGRTQREPRRPVPLGSIEADERERIVTGIGELDRALGGGIVPGAVVLVGGDPGIGKSTLLLQVSAALADSGESVV